MFETLLDWIAHHPQGAQWILMGTLIVMGLAAFRLVWSLTGRILLLALFVGLSLAGSYLLVRIRQGRLTTHRTLGLRASVVRSSWKQTGRRCRLEVHIEHLLLESVNWGCGHFEPDRTRLLPASCKLTIRCGRWIRTIESGGSCRFASATGRLTFDCGDCAPADSVSLDTDSGDLVYSEDGRRLVAKLSNTK